MERGLSVIDMRIFKNLLIVPTAVVLLSVTGCLHKGTQTVVSDPFQTDSVAVGDTLMMDGCMASVSISGWYPVETDLLADSVRRWVTNSLYDLLFDSVGDPFDSAGGVYTDGQMMVHTYCDSVLSRAAVDFAELKSYDGGYNVNYEYVCSFGNVYESDRILSYNLFGYTYLGGAHGSSVVYCASFNRQDGSVFTYENTFLPSKRQELVQLVKQELWNQYFSQDSGGETLSDMLLINPDELDLPVAGPEFTEKGILFTYQQYEIAPYALGMPLCIIPYEVLMPFMLPSVVEMVAM